jgi:hypothetical protein
MAIMAIQTVATVELRPIRPTVISPTSVTTRLLGHGSEHMKQRGYRPHYLAFVAFDIFLSFFEREPGMRR